MLITRKEWEKDITSTPVMMVKIHNIINKHEVSFHIYNGKWIWALNNVVWSQGFDTERKAKNDYKKWKASH